MNPGDDPDRTVSSSFPPTHWSMVIKARSPETPQAKAALDELCSSYWYPIYAFVRRKGNDPDHALDLTQSFFARLLEKDVLATVEQGKGRFRSFLRVVCKNFLIDQNRREKADPTANVISIDAHDAESRYQFEPADLMTPERIYERAWAMTVLARALDLLAHDYTRRGEGVLFGQLKIVLTQGRKSVNTAALAAQLGTSEDAIHTAVHRLRKRYRKILEQQIVTTLDDPADLDDEIRSLLEAIQS